MARPIEALIHQSTLAHHVRRVRECAPGTLVFAVVKANAYGSSSMALAPMRIGIGA